MTRQAGLKERVYARLDARLNHRGPEPVALALSGGGDSRALMALTAGWARERQRKLLVLTVDHRLNPDSGNWTEQAAKAARAEGADWQGLVWTTARAGSAVQARARQARHGLLAQAARAQGARVILLGHTQDDVAENLWMQGDGGTVGDLREWSPSPVWPEGRGIMLMRPLLEEKREALRDYLRLQGMDWIDDPANEDSHYHRVRARKAMALTALTGEAGSFQHRELPVFVWQAGGLAPYGVLEFSRKALSAASGRGLATALLCASGQSRPPRGERLKALQARLVDDGDFTAVLSGARVEVSDDRVMILREAGEMQRSGLGPLALMAGQSHVWDGRFEISAKEEGHTVLPARGLMASLDDRDREQLLQLPASVRPTMPVIVCQGSERVVLAFNKAKVTALAVPRFLLNCPAGMGETTQEAGLFASIHGITRSTTLFSV